MDKGHHDVSFWCLETLPLFMVSVFDWTHGQWKHSEVACHPQRASKLYPWTVVTIYCLSSAKKTTTVKFFIIVIDRLDR